ncbi:hypothetical protein OG21DRAFT_1513588 [Imleria badia]|nr:hypothetical protein OG21DRAFT_1513588 [Imleria badia]
MANEQANAVPSMVPNTIIQQPGACASHQVSAGMLYAASVETTHVTLLAYLIS